MKNKGKVGYILSGVVLGVAITATAPTLAATVNTITAKLQGDVKVTINGKTVAAKPINYNNQNYLPVGDIGRALGADVKFDKENNSIVVTGKEVEKSNGSGTNSGADTSSGTGTTVSELDPVADNSGLKPVYEKGEQINFANSTFKVVSTERKPFNDKVDEITVKIEASVEQMKLPTFPLRYIDFIKGAQAASSESLSWTYLGEDPKALPYNQITEGEFVVYAPIGDKSIQLKVTDPTQFYNVNSKRTANAPLVSINID